MWSPSDMVGQLPETIREQIAGESYSPDTIGQSGSSVLLFRDKVLKIQSRSVEASGELQMLAWLQGKLPVPKILVSETVDDRMYLLMSRCPGKMACDCQYMDDAPTQARLLSEGLRALWDVDAADCPVDQSLRAKLAAAACRVENGLVDLENVEPETFGPGGFRDPEALLTWLMDNRPEETPVLSHGDYCLPNVLFYEGRLSGLVDLGRCGVADKWCDIALCWRSLRNNRLGRYGGGVYPDAGTERLFSALGIVPEWDKLRYYLLLDELF